MSTWRLLGELPRPHSLQEVREQFLGDWNPWQQPSEPSGMAIVVPDFVDAPRFPHATCFATNRNGATFRFAKYLSESRIWRFYVPASPGEAGAFEALVPRYEGYWRPSQKDADDLPWPESENGWAGQAAFLRALHLIEKNARAIAYRGISPCRLCGRGNGHQSFQFREWEWPEGFQHYVADHQVRPTDDFREFITSQAAQLSLSSNDAR